MFTSRTGYGNHRVVVFTESWPNMYTWLRQGGTTWQGACEQPGGRPGRPYLPSRTAAIRIGNFHIAVNDMVYTCDRGDDRINVYTKTGEYQRTIAVVPGTGVTLGLGGAPGLGTAGSAWDLTFTADGNDRFFVEADGGNEIIAHHAAQPGRYRRRVRHGGAPARPVHVPARRHSRLEGQPLHGRDDQRPTRPEVPSY